MKIGVLGSGSWGTALSQVLCDNRHEVLVYGRNENEVKDINENARNSAYFGDLSLGEGIAATSDLSELAAFSDAYLLAVPSGAIASVLSSLAPYIKPHTVIINAAKGFDLASGKRLSEFIRETLSCVSYRGVVTLVGPSHAEEVIRRMLTSVAAVSLDLSLAETVQQLFSNSYMRVYAATDEKGAEYGAAVKNVIALASGMLEGQGYGDNAKAALITRGLAEIVRYGTEKGASQSTFFGLTGVGDLIVTCFSKHSRNYRAGLSIGRADSAKALSDIKETVEGIQSARAVYRDAGSMGVEMPIVEGVYRVLFEGAKPSEEITRLMTRPLRTE